MVKLLVNIELVPIRDPNTLVLMLLLLNANLESVLVFALFNKWEICVNVPLCFVLQYGEYFMLNDLLMFINDVR